MKILRITFKTLISILVFIVAVLIIYVLYVVFQYSRIEDKYDLTNDVISNNQVEKIDNSKEYTISTYNIGFGAYTRDYTFFMDSGVMKDGTKVKGVSAKAKSKEVVLNNVNGAITLIDYFDSDFMFFQEVDTNSTRSHHINQYEMLQNTFKEYDSIIGFNYHSAYLAYPLYDNIGKTMSGVSTFSKYKINSVMRYSLPIDESFPTKFFDLDRCFTISRVKIDNTDKMLVLINVHLSAYDEGGKIRTLQVEYLMNILEQEKNNYVIVGGDFNHDIASSDGIFASNQYKPEWVQIFPYKSLISGYTFATSINCPTCRSTDIAYQEGVNYTVVIDGFIVSNNIQVLNVTNIDTLNNEDVNFLYSDHNPVIMKFKLLV